MNVTPAGFAHMTAALRNFNIPLCLILEGGYFLDSIEVCAEWTLRALLSYQLPSLQLLTPKKSFVFTLHRVIDRLAKEFQVFKDFAGVREKDKENLSENESEIFDECMV